MGRQITCYLRFALATVLAVAITLSFSARLASHNPTDLSLLAATQQIEIEEHGHSHDEIVSVIDAFHGHAHDVADHDHTVAFLLPDAPSAGMRPVGANRNLANVALPDRRQAGLDRPPRV